MKSIISFTFFLSIALLFSGCSQRSIYSGNIRTKSASQNNQTRYLYKRLKKHPSPHIEHEKYQNEFNSAIPTRNLMVRIAESTIGSPYKWGGDNPNKGFDCSGLMTYIHKNALGIKIPRTAAKQQNYSRTINYSQLQPGDLLFFKTGKKTNHVGMYIGNRQFVHAPSSRKRVKIANMDSPYWYSRFVKFGTFL